MIHAKTGDKTQKTKKKHRWIFFLLLSILFILAGVGYWFFGRPADDFYFDKQARDGLIKARTKEDVQKILDTVVEKGMFNASINPNRYFLTGRRKATFISRTSRQTIITLRSASHLRTEGRPFFKAVVSSRIKTLRRQSWTRSFPRERTRRSPGLPS